MLVAEAGTGTGKTFAYLLPCLLSRKKTLISTATKTLQDQLFNKDIPLLLRSLGIAAKVQNLKGRSNYVCHYRVHLHQEQGQYTTPECSEEISIIAHKISQMQQGDRSELPEIKEDSLVWNYVTSTTENCLGNECSFYNDCFLLKARKRAMAADLVIINHHLYFADSRLKSQGFGELLPGVDVVVFDEAHQLAEIASQFNGSRIGTRQFKELLNDIIKEWPSLDLANQPLKTLQFKIEDTLLHLIETLNANEERISWSDTLVNDNFQTAWKQWNSLQNELIQCFNSNCTQESSGFIRCKERLLEFKKIFDTFSANHSSGICWLERFKKTLVANITPYEVKEVFHNLLKKYPGAYIFTSATLTMNQSFASFCNPLGLDNSTTLLLPSPFNFVDQTLLYLPRGLPDPKSSLYYEALLKKVIPVIEELEGRCFFLFTSHRALKEMAAKLSLVLPYPVLIQGEEAKPILLERFRQLGNAVLCGTATFWEGVDVKGEALSCVIIDKIPFASPMDPINRAKMHFLKAKGKSGFDDYLLPQAVIALKQGVGRLIRDINDKGVLVLADPRIIARDYGQSILKSLPVLPITRDEQKVLSFIKNVVLKNEAISN